MEKRSKIYIIVALLFSSIEIIIFLLTVVIGVVLLYYTDPYNKFPVLYKLVIVSYCIVMSFGFTMFRVAIVIYGFITIKQLYRYIIKDIIRVKNLTLKDVLANEQLLFGFASYCKKVQVSEVLECIMAIRIYKTKDDLDERMIEYGKIVTKFIKPESPQEVNIAYRERAPLLGIYQYFQDGKKQKENTLNGEAVVKREMRRRARMERRRQRITGKKRLSKTKDDLNHFNKQDIKRARKESYDDCPIGVFDHIETGLEFDLLGHYVNFIRDKGYTDVAKQYVGLKKYRGHYKSAIFYQTDTKSRAADPVCVNPATFARDRKMKKQISEHKEFIINTIASSPLNSNDIEILISPRKPINAKDTAIISSPRRTFDLTQTAPRSTRFVLGEEMCK